MEYLPETVAPNTLTVLGLLGTVIPFGILLGVCGCTLCGDVPAWFFFIHAITYFVYHILNEIYSLGFLFDHGRDCLTIGMQLVKLNIIF